MSLFATCRSSQVNCVNGFSFLITHVISFMISVYQWALSPYFGRNCRFYPSCSHYAQKAVNQYGPYKGSVMAGMRVLRCHPWCEGGYDPVPEK